MSRYRNSSLNIEKKKNQQLNIPQHDCNEKKKKKKHITLQTSVTLSPVILPYSTLQYVSSIYIVAQKMV